MPEAYLLTSEEKRFLLTLARNTIKSSLVNKKIDDPAFFSDTLSNKHGVFVTLNLGNRLRGCIGYIEGVVALQQAVKEMALSAAFNDPRFPALTIEELPDVEIEISVLSPLHKISTISEIMVGEHGIVIEHGINKGLLLPQVAVEYGWDRESFLAHTCQKAGLTPDAWRDSAATIHIFSAEIFSESELIVS